MFNSDKMSKLLWDPDNMNWLLWNEVNWTGAMWGRGCVYWLYWDREV